MTDLEAFEDIEEVVVVEGVVFDVLEDFVGTADWPLPGHVVLPMTLTVVG